MNDIYLYKEESYQITGALFEVHKELGCGFLEKVYQEALAIEFEIRGIPFEREKRFALSYKGRKIPQEYVADFVCYDRIIVELKALDALTGAHYAQVVNYLKATGLKLAILANFGEKYMNPKRLLNEY